MENIIRRASLTTSTSSGGVDAAKISKMMIRQVKQDVFVKIASENMSMVFSKGEPASRHDKR